MDKIRFLYMIALYDGVDALLEEKASYIPELNHYYWNLGSSIYWFDMKAFVEGLLNG